MAPSEPNRRAQPASSTTTPDVDHSTHTVLEAFAVDLARLAGSCIERSLDEEITVAYKDEAGRGLPPMDAVTNADRDIEELLVKRIRSAFPDHGILGEEGTQHFPPGHDYTWVLDPIDGTQNFVNGLPFYACSVGVLHHGRPVAGAIWGATAHRLRPGVYHARSGGSLRFEGVNVATARPSKGKLRSLSAMPHDEDQHVRPEQMEPVADYRLPWDRRHVGSGALEAAFVAAGIFDSAFNTGPRCWDIAAGALLVQAAGRNIWALDGSEWRPLTGFGESPEDLVTWRRPVLMATEQAYHLLID